MANTAINRESVWWLFLEGSAIVLSILLAFSIDAWWQDRQQQGEERLVLQSVLDELESIRRNVRLDLASTIEMRKSVVALLSQQSDSKEIKPNQNIDSLLADTTWIITPAHYSAPVLQATMSSGQLSLVSHPDLRLELGIWSNRLSDVELIVSRDSNVVFERLLPIYGREGSLLQIISNATCQPGVPENCSSLSVELPEGQRVDHTKVLEKHEIQGVLVERMITLSDIIDFGLSDLDTRLGVTTEKLQAELND